MKGILTLSGFFLLVASSVPAPAASRSIDKHFHQRFAVAAGARLALDHGDGDVEIVPWTENAIEVDVVYKAEITRLGPGHDTDFSVTFDQKGDTVRVEGHEPGGVVIGMLRIHATQYRYRIQAPPWVVLSLDGDDGDVALHGWRAGMSLTLDDGALELEDVRGQATIRTEDGDVRISRFTGRLSIEADDGDVTIRQAECPSLRVEVEDSQVLIDQGRGRFTVESDDGDVDLRRIRAGRIEVTTADGDVRLELAAADGVLDVEAETDDGDIDVTLAAGIGLRFNVRMDDGRVDVDLPGAEVDRRDHRVVGRVGDAAGDLRITTADGDVTIREQ